MPKTVTPEALLASSVSLTAATRLKDMSGDGTSGRGEANRADIEQSIVVKVRIVEKQVRAPRFAA